MLIITLALIATLAFECIEMRSIDKLSNLVIPENWKTDAGYNFQWKGKKRYQFLFFSFTNMYSECWNKSDLNSIVFKIWLMLFNRLFILFLLGSFTFGLPPDSACPRVFQPENGRFVCSSGTLIERNMCLVECKKGYEQRIPPVVYICEGGIWKSLRHQPISTPEPHCVPRSDNMKDHFPH